MKQMEDEIRDLKRQCKNGIARQKRAKRKMAKYLEMLKEKNLLTEELEEKIQTFKCQILHLGSCQKPRNLIGFTKEILESM